MGVLHEFFRMNRPHREVVSFYVCFVLFCFSEYILCLLFVFSDPGSPISNKTASPRPSLPLAVYVRAEPCA